MDLQLKGKTALVSGSTAGIGRATAAALAREGARAIVNGRSQASVDSTVEALRSKTGGDVQGFAGDLSQASLAEDVARRYPEVDILVNNLGIFEAKPFEDIPDEDWRRFFDVNVLSGVRLARLFLPAMKRANWGRIIFISSESAVQIPAEMIHYGMTKTAQLAVSRGLAEVARRHRDHRQLRPARPDALARGERFRRIAGQARGEVVRRAGKGVFPDNAPDLADPAIRLAGRDRLARRLCRQSPFVGDHGGGAQSRRGRDPQRVLISEVTPASAGASARRSSSRATRPCARRAAPFRRQSG